MEPNRGNDTANMRPSILPQTVPSPPALAVPEHDPSVITWNASEFIDHQKNFIWFLPLTLVVILLSGLVYLTTRGILATLVILLGGVAFSLFARQKPRTLSYSLLPTTIVVGDKKYPYDDFKTFSIVQEGPIYSVFLEPIRRFMPPLSIYFPPEEGEKIFDTLATHIPHQERQSDPVDSLMRRIRF